MGATLAEIDDKLSALADRVSRVESAVAGLDAKVAHNREASDDRHREVMGALTEARAQLTGTTDRLFSMIEVREKEAAAAAAEIRGAILKGAAVIVTGLGALIAGGVSLSECPHVSVGAPSAVVAPAPPPPVVP